MAIPWQMQFPLAHLQCLQVLQQINNICLEFQHKQQLELNVFYTTN